MSTDSPQVQALKERYKESFQEKLTVVQSMLDDMGRMEDFTSIREELHKLAGSSGMYGYSDISGACRSAIECIDDDHESGLAMFLSHLIGLLEQQV